MRGRLLCFLFLCAATTASGFVSYVLSCPAGWESFEEFCYRFVPDPVGSISECKSQCQRDGAVLVSVNSQQEHEFVEANLVGTEQGESKRDWWTSGRRMSDVEWLTFYWEGDGKKIESFFYWHNDSIPHQKSKNYILYNYNGFQWGWILGLGSERRPYICKISKDEIYRINSEKRGPDYGIGNPDLIPRGPTFTVQPSDVVYDSEITEGISALSVVMDCLSDGFPDPTYRWRKLVGSEMVDIEPKNDERYTFNGGKLMINLPQKELGDETSYQCVASNQFGSILSRMAKLEFGFLNMFPRSPRSPVRPYSYQSVTIDCNPPLHYPPGLRFSWYKNDIRNFIRPELKPHLFISYDGNLYFSEVTPDDDGDYFCSVSPQGMKRSETQESQPTLLDVQEASGGDFEPKIGKDFPKIFPPKPAVGDVVRFECWAHGTSSPVAMSYSWVRLDDNGNEIELPPTSRLIDHNRVLHIERVQLYEAGTYRCRVTRKLGSTDTKTIRLILQAAPFFVLPLEDQFLDAKSDLSWRCEAGGLPSATYFWLRNGRHVTEGLPAEEADRYTLSNNVLRIRELNGKFDNGMYQCSANNTFGIRYSSGELRVISFAPDFSKYPLQPNQLASVSGDTKIFCRPEAAPAPEITWLKDGRPLNPGSGDEDRVQQLPNGNLIIRKVSKSDEGVYVCSASNEHGEAESRGNLTVVDQIVITVAPETSTVVRQNNSAFIHCIASYDYQADVTYIWYHGDRLVEFERIYHLGEHQYQIWYNPHYKRGEGLYVGGLLIVNAQYEHSGRYTCQVTTSGTKIQRYGDLKVQGPPYPPAAYIDQKENAATWTIIKWKEGFNNGVTVTSFIIDAFNYWERIWREHETGIYVNPDDTETYTYNVTNLRPYSSYHLRIHSVNSAGISEPSEATDEFTTAPVEPDLVPEELGGGGGKVGDLVITWKPLAAWQENGPNIGYKVHWKKNSDDEFNNQFHIVHGSVSRHVILLGQSNFYQLYDVAIQAFNDVGDGPLSNISTIRSAMDMPTATATSIKAIPYNATCVEVTWIPVEDTIENIHGKLGGYKIGYWPIELGPFVDNPHRTTMSGQHEKGLIIGLYPNTKYYFRVYVWNDAGNGPPSEWFMQRTLRSAPINMPTEVHAWKISNTEVEVTWRGVITAQDEEPLEGYKVRIWPDGADIKAARPYDISTLKHTKTRISNLDPDIFYKVRIFGHSRGGDGAMSSPALLLRTGAACVFQTSKLSIAFSYLLVFLSNS